MEVGGGAGLGSQFQAASLDLDPSCIPFGGRPDEETRKGGDPRPPWSLLPSDEDPVGMNRDASPVPACPVDRAGSDDRAPEELEIACQVDRDAAGVAFTPERACDDARPGAGADPGVHIADRRQTLCLQVPC